MERKPCNCRQFERADAGTRTPDPFITSEVLYQLSYVGVERPVYPGLGASVPFVGRSGSSLRLSGRPGSNGVNVSSASSIKAPDELARRRAVRSTRGLIGSTWLSCIRTTAVSGHAWPICSNAGMQFRASDQPNRGRR